MFISIKVLSGHIARQLVETDFLGHIIKLCILTTIHYNSVEYLIKISLSRQIRFGELASRDKIKLSRNTVTTSQHFSTVNLLRPQHECFSILYTFKTNTSKPHCAISQLVEASHRVLDYDIR
jgi:hypothetical protein